MQLEFRLLFLQINSDISSDFDQSTVTGGMFITKIDFYYFVPMPYLCLCIVFAYVVIIAECRLA